jgi:hypothetical protein
MSTFSNSDSWNIVPEFWNLTDIYWTLIEENIRGGVLDDTYFKEKKKKNIPINESQYIKIYVTMYNEFMTEEDKRFFKLANIYPTYEDEILIKKNIKLVLENSKQVENKNQLVPEVILKNVKIGVEKIKNHVENNSKK